MRLPASPGALGTPAGDTAAGAVILDPDPLRRLLAVAAAAALGIPASPVDPHAASCSPADPATRCPATALPDAPVVFVALDGPLLCARSSAPAPAVAAAPRRAPRWRPLVIGYGVLAAPLAAHRLHGCADAVLQLTAADDEARFTYLPPATFLDVAGVTPREADVLILLLAGARDQAIARRLCVSPATARSHVRALLRKLDAADRRALRARLLPAAAFGQGDVIRAAPVACSSLRADDRLGPGGALG